MDLDLIFPLTYDKTSGIGTVTTVQNHGLVALTIPSLLVEQQRTSIMETSLSLRF